MRKLLNRNCKHCFNPFEARRSNHVYCSLSCKTKASYKRNGYTYVSGHYKKEEHDAKLESNGLHPDANQELLNTINALGKKIEGINDRVNSKGQDISSSALGSALSDTTVYAAKKLFAPNTLPATKGDVAHIKREVQRLSFLLKEKFKE